MKKIKKGWKVFKLSFDIATKVRTVWSLVLASIFTELLFLVAVALIIFIAFDVKLTEVGLEKFKTDLLQLPEWNLWLFGVLTTYVFVLIATFFNFAISFNILEYLRKNRLVSVSESISFSFSRIIDVNIWTLVLLTVSIIFNILNSISEKLGAVGGLIMKFVNGLLGTAWNLVTLFVIPVYVENEGKTVKSVLKTSKDYFVETWGESVVATVSVGFFTSIFFLGTIISGMLLSGFAFTVSPVLGFSVFGIFVLIWIFVLIFSAAMDKIFKILLYIYAKDKTLPEWIDAKDIIKNAYQKKEK